MTHWATQLIGKPHERSKQGPDSFDCWGLAKYVQRTQYGITLPDVPTYETWRDAYREIEQNAERELWSVVTRPRESDLVLMCRNKIPVHIGTWIHANGGLGVLHCLEGSGVVFQTEASLRASGWGRLTTYRRASCQLHKELSA